MFNIDNITRGFIKDLTPYSSARDEFTGVGEVFLDANENPFGATLHENITVSKDLNRYPDPLQTSIKTKLAKIKGVKEENIFLGNGSDEAIDLLMRAFCQPQKDSIVTMPPTYGMYKVSASINDVSIKTVPLTTDFDIDLEALQPEFENSNNKLLFACSPNNPTANLLSLEKVKTLCQNFKGLVIVDEAYIDFAPDATFLKELNNYPNLVVIQTFSKAWGMANVRLGMMFASKAIIDIINKIKPPYNVNGVTQQIALQALENESQKEQMVAELIAERSKLLEQLEAIDCITKVYPSDANFILVKTKDANSIYNALVAKGIIVRNRTKELNCENCIRITVGTPAENEKLIKELQNL
jgi:histidinol-phosphate aminotransferase